jgi:hypothetical protein
MRIEERRPELDDEGEQFLHIGIFGSPERSWIEPGGGQKSLWINAAAMRGIENERHL